MRWPVVGRPFVSDVLAGDLCVMRDLLLDELDSHLRLHCHFPQEHQQPGEGKLRLVLAASMLSRKSQVLT